MSTASATPETLAKVRDALAFLRRSGRDDEAAAIESLLPAARPRRLPTAPPSDERELVLIAEAAARLRLGRNAVQRRIDIGLLEGIRNERNGYRFVTRASLDRLLDMVQMQEAIMAFPYYLDAGPIDPDSLLGQLPRVVEEDAEDIDDLGDLPARRARA